MVPLHQLPLSCESVCDWERVVSLPQLAACESVFDVVRKLVVVAPQHVASESVCDDLMEFSHLFESHGEISSSG